jgi:photosystem II stability/assembly factor-like uncharacterized protein
VNVLAECGLGTVVVDLETEECRFTDDPFPEDREPTVLSLPRIVSADAVFSTVVAVVARRPPMLVSHDAGTTWVEAGAGLPAGVDAAISPDDPDTIVFAGSSRLFLSRDGGRFWTALAVELPAITRVAWSDERKDM